MNTHRTGKMWLHSRPTFDNSRDHREKMGGYHPASVSVVLGQDERMRPLARVAHGVCSPRAASMGHGVCPILGAHSAAA